MHARSIAEKIIFCSFNFSGNTQLENEQKVYAKDLSDIYENGSEGFARDRRKAATYRAAAGLPPLADEPKSILGTGVFYLILGWFHSLRLAGIRFERFFVYPLKKLFKRLLCIGGLFYLGSFIFDFSVALASALRCETEAEKNLSFWTRFKNALKKDARPNRMANDGFWAIVNFTTFFVTGGVAPAVINLVGFSFDVCHEVYKACAEIIPIKQYYDKIKHDLALQKEVLSQHLTQVGSFGFEDRKNEIQTEIKNLECIKKQVESKIKWSVTQRSMTILGVTLALIGMGLLFFPPTTHLGAFTLAGGITALVGGSVIEGLGKRLTLLTVGLFKKIVPKRKNEKPADAPKPKRYKKNSYGTHCRRLLSSKQNILSPTIEQANQHSPQEEIRPSFQETNQAQPDFNEYPPLSVFKK